MTNVEREIKRKLRVLKHAEKSGNINKTVDILVCFAPYFMFGVKPIDLMEKKD